MKYKSILVTERGGPEVMQIVENDLRAPGAEQARVRIQATPVCQDDIAVRLGNRPFLAKPPFVPGYSILGIVDEIDESVTQVAKGDRVAALTNFGGYAEYIYINEDQLVHVPNDLDPAEAVVLILNYLVACQILHRVAGVKANDKVLIVGASGGVGTAFLQLGALAGVKMYGLASPGKHQILEKYGAVPIDYHTQDFIKVIKHLEPCGIDYVFNGMGEEYLVPGMKVLIKGGVLVHYGGPQSMSSFLLLVAELIVFNLLPNGKKIKGYGTHRLSIDLLKEDWSMLFAMLDKGQIKPVIAAKYPILEAAEANRQLEGGSVVGNIVLLAPDLL